jgi:transposase-like protein
MAINLTDPVFTDEAKAREHLEAIRWPDGRPVCVHCGSVDKVYRLAGKAHRKGLFHCNDCEGQFTVTTGGVMESSHVPLNKWVLAFRLMASSKKGISAHQLHRTIKVTYKTAWFMAHRVRGAMRLTNPTPMGGEGEIIESDEAYWGPKDKDGNGMNRRRKGKPGKGGKQAILTLVQRGGKSRSFVMESLTTKDVFKVLRENADLKSNLMTDEGTSNNWEFAQHDKIKHGAKEYARYEHTYDENNNKLSTKTITTNTVEGFFGVFKRGMRGTYQHCGPQHLQRYMDEFDFRYSNRMALGVDDSERAVLAIRGAEGKRLTYQGTRSAK